MSRKQGRQSRKPRNTRKHARILYGLIRQLDKPDIETDIGIQAYIMYERIKDVADMDSYVHLADLVGMAKMVMKSDDEKFPAIVNALRALADNLLLFQSGDLLSDHDMQTVLIGIRALDEVIQQARTINLEIAERTINYRKDILKKDWDSKKNPIYEIYFEWSGYGAPEKQC